MVSTGAGPTVAAVGIYEPVMTTGFMTVTFVFCASTAIAPRREPIRPTSMILLKHEGIFFWKVGIITLIGFSLDGMTRIFLAAQRRNARKIILLFHLLNQSHKNSGKGCGLTKAA